ncbi:MAG: hypothetical protein KY395_03530 [Actinobacteria bacterium]|nr:hypothetical protein [Actinomycetota bacterium]
MPKSADRNLVQELLEQRDAQLAEVLPHEEYEDEHLPDAVHLPLREIDADSTAGLDRGRPIIVYCWDFL